MTDPFASHKKSSQKKKKSTINSFEVFKPDGPSETVNSLDMFKPKDLGKALGEQVKPQDNWMKDWLGLGNESHGGGGHSVDMQPGVSYTPGQMAEMQKAQEAAEKAETKSEAAMDYSREILHAGENQNRKEQQESHQKVQMIIQELQRLAQSVQQIEKTMVLQAISPDAGQKAGKYYESFFEWMLMVVQDARRQVEDSGAWLNATTSKKKGIHKTMKTNMQVGMSGERTQANNAG